MMPVETGAVPQSHAPHVMPWWLGWLLINPARRLLDNPAPLFAPLVTEGMTVVELGPGMGFFTTELAQRVGPSGKVVCVDVQEKMLAALRKRLARRGLLDRVETRACEPLDTRVTDLAGRVDLVVLIAVLHETPDPASTLRQLAEALHPGGRLLLLEPSSHCAADLFAAELRWAEAAGLRPLPRPAGARRSQHAALFERT